MTNNTKEHSSNFSFAEIAPVAFFFLLLAAFGALSPDVFLSGDNITTILNNAAILAIIACGLTLVLIVGEFDLTIGANASFAGAIAAVLIAQQGYSLWSVILIVGLIGLLVGLINGFLVAFLEIPALIATIGVASILDGLSLWITGSSVIFSGFTEGFMTIGSWQVSQLQAPFIYLIVIAIWLAVAMKYTTFGRHLYATGGSREASRMSGIRIRRQVILAFVGCGLLAAFAGFVYTSRQGSLTPLFGTSFLLPAFAAAFLGSVTLSRKSFHIIGTVLGVYLIETGTTGLLILGAPAYTQQLFAGIVLLLATGGSRLKTLLRR